MHATLCFLVLQAFRQRHPGPTSRPRRFPQTERRARSGPDGRAPDGAREQQRRPAERVPRARAAGVRRRARLVPKLTVPGRRGADRSPEPAAGSHRGSLIRRTPADDGGAREHSKERRARVTDLSGRRQRRVGTYGSDGRSVPPRRPRTAMTDHQRPSSSWLKRARRTCGSCPTYTRERARSAQVA